MRRRADRRETWVRRLSRANRKGIVNIFERASIARRQVQAEEIKSLHEPLVEQVIETAQQEWLMNNAMEVEEVLENEVDDEFAEMALPNDSSMLLPFISHPNLEDIPFFFFHNEQVESHLPEENDEEDEGNVEQEQSSTAESVSGSDDV